MQQQLTTQNLNKISTKRTESPIVFERKQVQRRNYECFGIYFLLPDNTSTLKVQVQLIDTTGTFTKHIITNTNTMFNTQKMFTRAHDKIILPDLVPYEQTKATQVLFKVES